MEDMTHASPNAVYVHKPHGFVDLVDCRADDLMVVNAARTSYVNRSEWERPEFKGYNADAKRLSERDEGLIRFLMKNRHGTPFEQNFFQFHVRAPIFVFREWHRHRIGISINEESGRYVELAPDFYVPDADHVRVQMGKPGSYTYEPAGDRIVDMGQRVPHKLSDYAANLIQNACNHAYVEYLELLRLGVAKELARTVLPVGIYSQMLWTCNARSLMAFLSLRNNGRALQEIHDYAAVMQDMFEAVMPVTAQAFRQNGNVAP